jgi:NAD(P)-dependent dehydrogenase (short-subunit alcohol dehydrogenase family)
VFRLDGKRAVVTGAASGIGLAIASVFAANGAQLALLDLNAAAVESAATALAKEFDTAVTGRACDVSDEASVQAAFAAVGLPVDVLVNSAGIAHVGNLVSTSVADVDRLYAVNVKGTYLCMKSAIGPMTAAGKGVILNMASIAATSGLADRFAYSMSKGAVLAMTLSVAKDYLAKGVRCNCVSPARVHTPFVDGFVAKNYPGHEAEKLKELGASQPIGRMGRPDEIAALALYLCSDEASFLTGVDYPIDGGYFNLR